MNIQKNYEKILRELRNGTVYRYTNLETGEEYINENKAEEKEALQVPVQVVLCGGGHVGKAIYELCTFLGFEVWILDDRTEFCNKEIYPKAHIVNAAYPNSLSKTKDLISPYYIVVTRGHSFDYVCVKYIIDNCSYAYLGMIGSKTKVAATKDKLKENKVKEKVIDNIYAPIGLNFGAIGPKEIGISIVAEIISVYRNQKASIVDIDLYQAITKLHENFVIARIVKKNGSAPAQLSSTICVTKDKFLGTVGGGEIEYLVIEAAKAMLNKQGNVKPFVKHFSLAADKASKAGMICGGNVDLIFQKQEII